MARVSGGPGHRGPRRSRIPGLVLNTPLAYPHGTPVNEYLETDEKGIFAAGDVASFPDKILGGVRRIEHWNAAVAQGRVAGANMTGKKRIKFISTACDERRLRFALRFRGDFFQAADAPELKGIWAKRSSW